MRIINMTAGVVALTIAGQADAATLNTSFKIDGQIVCSGITADANGTKTCSSSEDVNGNLVNVTMQSREDNGNLGIGGTITVTDNRAGTNGGMSTVGEVSLNFTDTLFFSTSTGAHNFLLPFDLAGTLLAPEPLPDPTGGGGGSAALVNADLIANGVSSVLYTELHQGRTGIFDDEDFGGPSVGALSITEMLLPIVNGRIDLIVGLNGRVSCAARVEADGGPCTASFDFLNSLRLLGGAVLDVNGNEIAGANVSSASGFDYLKGVSPHVSSVPLPAALPLMLGTLALFGMIGWRRRRAV